MAKRSAKHGHGGTPALVALEASGVPHTVHPYEHDPASDLGYGLEAAQAIGVDPSLVLKTLVTSADGTLVVAVLPVDRTLDLKALAHAVGAKRAVLAEHAVAERATGYVVGGISPLGQRQTHPTVVDASVLGADVVYVSAGRRGVDVGLAPQDLVRLTGATTAPVARA
ncbi:Cys-tRNA(Pro) deacylase [Sanguibacter suaedae]|uniref:Cys-tRNA(Pro)/Cys-tRNA(Cys) deacylase n=1 Tax=Sanguibacter suaedae TaxID=2795737 RepID=A0A934M9D9_9MICO|nr:Cys-tRNA(Pro) deacylase [Sanguibacter suaedae]MBI9114490.1 Cys-tRNA(Pro) deacylase [Sanguibacter suaedae]